MPLVERTNACKKKFLHGYVKYNTLTSFKYSYYEITIKVKEFSLIYINITNMY